MIHATFFIVKWIQWINVNVSENPSIHIAWTYAKATFIYAYVYSYLHENIQIWIIVSLALAFKGKCYYFHSLHCVHVTMLMKQLFSAKTQTRSKKSFFYSECNIWTNQRETQNHNLNVPNHKFIIRSSCLYIYIYSMVNLNIWCIN